MDWLKKKVSSLNVLEQISLASAIFVFIGAILLFHYSALSGVPIPAGMFSSLVAVAVIVLFVWAIFVSLIYGLRWIAFAGDWWRKALTVLAGGSFRNHLKTIILLIVPIPTSVYLLIASWQFYGREPVVALGLCVGAYLIIGFIYIHQRCRKDAVWSTMFTLLVLNMIVVFWVLLVSMLIMVFLLDANYDFFNQLSMHDPLGVLLIYGVFAVVIILAVILLIPRSNNELHPERKYDINAVRYIFIGAVILAPVFVRELGGYIVSEVLNALALGGGREVIFHLANEVQEFPEGLIADSSKGVTKPLIHLITNGNEHFVRPQDARASTDPLYAIPADMIKLITFSGERGG